MNRFISQDLYHYFNYLKDPFTTYTSENLPSAEAYADMAKRIGRMQGYDVPYFKKRLERETFCRQFLENANGTVDRVCPIYATLGRKDELCIDVRLQPFSIAIPLCQLDLRQLLFVIGDSMGTDFRLLPSRIFTYEQFCELSDQDIQNMMPSDPIDRYIEVQIWENNYIRQTRELLKTNTLVYTQWLADEIVSAHFPHLLDLKHDSVQGWLLHIKEKGWLSVFADALRCGDRSYIPKGSMHGIPHSVRCAWLSFCLADLQGMSLQEAMMVAKCAAYHDCGRGLGYSQENHARSVPIEKLFFKEDAEVAGFIISCHNATLTEMHVMANSSGISVTSKEMAMAKIVHDADVLDYIRMTPERGIRHYDPQHLTLSTAQTLIPLALELFILSLVDEDWMIHYF